MRKFALATTAMAFAAGLALLPGTAQAWWRGPGLFFYGPPIVVGPPVIYAPPPPVVYAPPPPVVYDPAPAYAPAGQACYAAAYVCPLDQPTPAGGPCSCPTNNGRAYGRAR